MRYAITKDGDALTVAIWGRLDATSCPELESVLADELDGIADLTVDLAQVVYVSSMGLRLLLSWQKLMFKQGAMRIVNVPDEVMALFDETGFTEIIDIQ